MDGEFLCETCRTVAHEAEQYAVAENLDPGAERRKALSARAPSSMSHKAPNMLFDRIDTAGIATRMQKEIDNARDPRNTGR